MNKPLENIKILDLTRLLPGPMCTLHLADLGANVIKIEDPLAGDYARAVPPFQKNISKFFLAINRNKRSLTLDLKKKEGKKVFLELAKKADVVIESFRPGVVDKLGIGYKEIQQINPSIVYCSITGYGQTGPYSQLAGHDLNFLAYAGVIKPTPRSNGLPSIPNIQIGDLIGGTACGAMSIMAAILQQKTQGIGQYLDVSIMDGLLSHSVVGMSNVKSEELFGVDLSDMLNGLLHCYQLYPTKDNRYMALAALEYKFWERFCKALNREDLIARHLERGDSSTEVYEILIEIFKEKTMLEWVDHFNGVDCCLSPVLTIDEALEQPHVKEREVVVKHQHSQEGLVSQFSFPVKFSNYKFEIYQPAPLLGEHTNAILKELGYENDEVLKLKQDGIV